MRRLALLLGLLLVAAPLGGQQAPTIIAWDLGDPTHTAAVTWEVETASDGVVPCVSPTQTATEWRCSATFSRTAAQSIRIRGANGPSVGGWSALVPAPAVPAGQAPGTLTITWAGEVQGGGGTPMASFTDDFNRADSASLGANWAEEAGDADINSNRYRARTSGFATVLSIYQTPCAGIAQYVKVVSATSDFYYPIIALRFTNASSPLYVVYIEGNTGNVEWARLPSAGGSGSTIATGALGAAVNAADSVGVTVEGTGTGTIVRVWRNPSGDAPTAADTWGGASAGVTWTTDPAAAVDAGSYVGIGAAQGTADQVVIQDFFGGDIPSAAPSAPFPPFARRTRFLTRSRHARILPPPGLPGFSRDPVTGLHLPAIFAAPGAPRKAA